MDRYHLNRRYSIGSQRCYSLPQKGEVSVKGEPVGKKNLKDTVGIVYQNPDDQVFLPTVRLDVAFGPTNLGLQSDVVEQRVETALNNVGLTPFGLGIAIMQPFFRQGFISKYTVHELPLIGLPCYQFPFHPII